MFKTCKTLSWIGHRITDPKVVSSNPHWRMNVFRESVRIPGLHVIWRGVRVVEGDGLEIRCTVMQYRGFESLPLRNPRQYQLER